MRWTRWAQAGLILMVCLAVFGWMRWRPAEEAAMLRKLAQVMAGSPGLETSCARLQRQAPLMLLVMGQSNAANHGEDVGAEMPLDVTHQGRCYSTPSPLPGGTGRGVALWPQLGAELRSELGGRTPLVGLIAVEATSIRQWLGTGPLAAHWRAQLAQMLASGFRPDLVLWQQGESDARLGTTEAEYGLALQALRQELNQAGVSAPMMVALSTHCPGVNGAAVRAAIQALGAQQSGIIVGPDTDSLQGSSRSGGCHFSAAGVRQAAKLWASRLRAAGLTSKAASQH